MCYQCPREQNDLHVLFESFLDCFIFRSLSTVFLRVLRSVHNLHHLFHVVAPVQYLGGTQGALKPQVCCHPAKSERGPWVVRPGPPLAFILAHQISIFISWPTAVTIYHQSAWLCACSGAASEDPIGIYTSFNVSNKSNFLYILTWTKSFPEAKPLSRVGFSNPLLERLVS